MIYLVCEFSSDGFLRATITRGGVYALEKEKQAFCSTRQRRTTVEVWHPPHPRIVLKITLLVLIVGTVVIFVKVVNWARVVNYHLKD